MTLVSDRTVVQFAIECLFDPEVLNCLFENCYCLCFFYQVVDFLIHGCNSNLRFLYSIIVILDVWHFPNSIYMFCFNFSLDKYSKAQTSLWKWIYFVHSRKFWVNYGLPSASLQHLQINLAYGSVW